MNMKRFDNNLIEKIRNRARLVDITSDYTRMDSKKKGSWAYCPFHNESNASLHLEPKRGVYYCHGCQAKGDVFTMVMKLSGLSFGEAVRHVAERFNIPIDDEVDDERIQAQYKMRQALDIAAKHYQDGLVSSMSVRAYLEGRGVTEESQKKWGIGFSRKGDQALINKLKTFGLTTYAEDAGILKQGKFGIYEVFGGRLVFPIKNKVGKIVTFAGRDISGESRAKYINGKETSLYQKSHVLYGMKIAMPGISENKQIIITEGYLDVIHMHQAGFTETVATCGTALTTDMVRSFSRLTKTAVCFFDSDKAGLAASMRALPVLSSYGVDAKLATLPDGLDPADGCAKDEVMVCDAVDAARPLLDVWLENLSSTYPSTPNGRQEAAIEIKPVINSYKDVAKDIVLRKAANVIGVSPAALRSLVSEAPNSMPEKEKERVVDTLSMSVARLCIVSPEDIPTLKKKLNIEWVDGEGERSLIKLLLKGAPIHEVVRKVEPFLQGPLLKLAVEEDEPVSVSRVLVLLELRFVERTIKFLKGSERLDAQRNRIKLKWAATH
tara:strand:- start:13402 stop:15054 length:1653 start_codon:yes stop_codon:yes gene_type:complete